MRGKRNIKDVPCFLAEKRNIKDVPCFLAEKRGKLITDEPVELILAVAVILVLALVLYTLIYPNFNRSEKVAESYFNLFKEAIGDANKGGTGVFSIWQKEENVRYYLVYFGEKISFNFIGTDFKSVGKNKNHICVCYIKKGKADGVCENCEDLEYPIGESGNGVWLLNAGKKIEIQKTTNENFYKLTERAT